MNQDTDTDGISRTKDHSTGPPAFHGRILVVDDDSDVLFTLKTVLQDAGYVVASSNSPKKVLEKYEPETYDLLIIDVKMPEISGFDLYKRIRERDQKCKVCFLTAGETYHAEFMSLFQELSETNFILKPVENHRLLSTTRKIIGSKKSDT